MISVFICECVEKENDDLRDDLSDDLGQFTQKDQSNDLFEIIREIDIKTNKTTRIYFRCSECGRDYEFDEVTQ